MCVKIFKIGMFYQVLMFICASSVIFVSSSDAFRIKKNITKRSDIDLQTCIENFDVHKDKIIRTQDSKDMGAKYINEIDLGSREECLRLCCETQNCDVFVFEEKNSGSCYLFQCGPPEDFKCKFTHHTNYSSAILAVNRHMPDLESQIKLTKHEQDLTKLSFRKGEHATEANNPQIGELKTTPAPATTPETKTPMVYITSKSTTEENKVIKCSRYQFECRSTKECIAIYNACDGIPQCADGSDEAPELGCPDSGTTAAPAIIQNNLAFEDISNGNLPQQPQKYYPAPMQEQQNVPMISNGQKPDFIRPNSRNPFIPHQAYVDNNQAHASYPQISPQANWTPHQPNQLPQYQQFDDRNSHIFNHKENGLQVSEGQDIRYNKHKGAMQTHLHRALGYSNVGQPQYGELNGRDNPKITNYMEDVYRQNPQYQEKWPKNIRYNNRNQFEGAPDPNQNWQQEDSDTQQYYDHDRSAVEQPATWKSIKQPHDHEKIAHELKHSKELMENLKNSNNKEDHNNKQIIIEKVQKHNDNVDYAKITQYKVTEMLDLEDGFAQTPGGAVLSLTLGLVITCVMALLIACRLRMVRRRIRRGGKSYAHDADYLVNGMYL